MIVHGSSCPTSLLPFNPTNLNRTVFSFSSKIARTSASSYSSPSPANPVAELEPMKALLGKGLCGGRLCCCRRRNFVETLSASALPPNRPLNASDLSSDSTVMLNKIRPPRPQWYEELYAGVMDKAMGSYEAEIAEYKSQLFNSLRGKVKEVAEIGIGTGPNLKYYANDDNLRVFGIDPNTAMEKYARTASRAAGLQPENFQFMQAVGEAIPLKDASVDAVIGTLVLCSVGSIDHTLQEVKRVLKPGGLYVFVEHVAAKDGTFLRFVQNVLNPLQRAVADGCHLNRETGKNIYGAGFLDVQISTAFLSSAILMNSHIYGIAYK